MRFKLFYPITLFRFPKWAKITATKSSISRYRLECDAVMWDKSSPKPLPLSNHIETSGLRASLLMSYRVEADYSIKRHVYVVFPELRLAANTTHSSFARLFREVRIEGGYPSSGDTDKCKKCSAKSNGSNRISTEDNSIFGNCDGTERAESIQFDGVVTITSQVGGATVLRSISAARDSLAAVESISVYNHTSSDISFSVVNPTPHARLSSVFCLEKSPIHTYVTVTVDGRKLSEKKEQFTIQPGDMRQFYVAYSAGSEKVNAEEQLEQRRMFVSEMKDKLVITTPDDTINAMLTFTKLRATESIFRTKGGYMHSPGGGGFYSAMWTNDECEYASPYFAYLDYDIARQSATNCLQWFGKFVSPTKSIVSSVISGGDSVWHGAGDRGDNAMYVYGLARYILTTGDREYALANIDRLVVATQYCISRINASGVVSSDSDELENRFLSGSANLSTSSIAYDALISMSYIMTELGRLEEADNYTEIAAKLRQSIENYFGATVEGYRTYRYCAEESALRSWICLPLTVGIMDRQEGSIAAIMSDRLRVGNGILTRSGETTYWDRSALYALRGIFMAGQADTALSLLAEYSAERLTGEHMPYPVEAYPEGNGAHLSAESALYQRIFIEGTLGYRPIGFRKFIIKPCLPDSWQYMNIDRISLCDYPCDIHLRRCNGGYAVSIQNGLTSDLLVDIIIPCGESAVVRM